MNTQTDTIETIGGTKIQHGKLNDRIYVMRLGENNYQETLIELDSLAEQNGYTKIFAKVPAHTENTFFLAGYRCEGRIPQFYHGKEEAAFLGKYFDQSRLNPANQDELQKVLELAQSKADSASEPKDDLPDGLSFHHCREEDAEAISQIYRQVFPTYPFPIHDPAYIVESMKSNVLYFSIRKGEEIVSLSSAEMDLPSKNVEMTDFATLPEWRGNSLASHLLAKMEIDMKKLGMKTGYTIARAVSPGMNIVFAKQGYIFGGRLVNNTNISGQIESMNIWHKPLT